MAIRTFITASFPLFPDHRRRHDPCRDRNNRVADQHHDSRKKTSGRRNGCYIAIPDSRHRHNRPIDTVRYVIKLRSGLVPFYHIHDRPDRSDQDQHEKEKDENLGCTDPERFQQQVPFLQEIKQLEHTKDPNQPECPDHNQIARTGKEKTKVDR